MIIKAPLFDGSVNGDFSTTLPLLIKKFHLISRMLQDDLNQSHQLDGNEFEETHRYIWALGDMLDDCIGDLQHINDALYASGKR